MRNPLEQTGARERLINYAPPRDANAGVPEPATPSENLKMVGKVAVISGGTRGIGRATALAFLQEGATVIALHTGTKQKRVDETIEAARAFGADKRLHPLKCDVTNADDIQGAVAFAGQFGKVDVVYNNAAGGFGQDAETANRINRDAKIALTEAFVPLLAESDDPRVLNIESALSEYPWLEGMEGYNPVAESKYEGKLDLRKRIKELNTQHGLNIKYAYANATGVEGTVTWDTLIVRRNPDVAAKMVSASEGGKPTNTETVAKAMVKLATAEDLRFGHAEQVGIPHLDQNAVEKQLDLYDDTSRKLDSVVFGDSQYSHGHYEVRPHDVAPIFSDESGRLEFTALDRPASDDPLPDGFFTATDAHAEGHFAGENPKIVPGYKLLAAAQETTRHVFTGLFGSEYSMAEVDNLHFKLPVLPGDKVDVYVHYRGGQEIPQNPSAYVEVKVGNAVVATIDQLTFRQGTDPNDHLKPMALEHAALSAGVTSLAKSEKTDLAPLFQGVEKISYPDPKETHVIAVEDELVSQTQLTAQTESGFTSTVTTRVEAQPVAEVAGLKCAFYPRERVMKLIERTARSRQKSRE